MRSALYITAAFLALCVLPAQARAGAFSRLEADAGAYAAPAPAPAAEQAFVYQGEVLPDDTIREDLPTEPEARPRPLPRPAGPSRVPFSFDPAGLIPAGLRAQALDYYQTNKQVLGNLRHIAVIDFSKHSSLPRFYIADTERGTVAVYHAAHGSGSDPDKDGYATIFSNVQDSNASSLGFYMTGDIYNGKHGRSMRLYGMSATNSNAYVRAVVIHAADYVSDANVQPGRSWGCPAVSKASLDKVIDALKGGALIYAGLSGGN